MELQKLPDKLEAKLENRTKDPYEILRGHLVKVCTPTSNYLGFYRGKTNDGDIILFPKIERIGEEEIDVRYVWGDLPEFICYQKMESVGPQSHEPVQKLLNKNRPQIIIP